MMTAQRELNTGSKKFRPELSEKVLEFQIKEMQLKEREIELRKKETDNNFHFAKESLKYQSEDFKDLRKQELTKERMIMIIIFISVFFFFAFLMAAMILNKDEILTDIIKVAGYVFGGGITGYGIGIHKNKEKAKQMEQV